MGSYHAHAPWRKAVLIPFWTIQLLLELLDLALLALAVGVIVTWVKNKDECSSDGYDCNLDWDDVSTAAKIVVPIWMAMLVICLILTITEIVLLARHKLKPKTFVIFNTIKTFIWTVIFALDIVSFVDSNSRTVSFVGLIIEAVLWLCFLIPLIYGSVIYHRTRHSYAPVTDPNNPTDNTLPEFNLPANDPYTGYSAKAYASTNTDIESQSPFPTDYSHPRDTRFEALRRTSYGEAYTAYGGASGANEGYTGQVPPRGAGSLSARGSPEIPQVFVQHHDGDVFEMESSRRGLR
ncbi:uncharacterized protein PAC_08351 [Phialocephala subalpina]|uniref:Uncharacterized protein n=1 Tax=Phialocephala subalpina TaxID=576137 RepID=A0A1L7X0B7_9HELO|nr:uncharacterized protein PAC_08351 [Phialocephala subalpina]